MPSRCGRLALVSRFPVALRGWELTSPLCRLTFRPTAFTHHRYRGPSLTSASRGRRGADGRCGTSFCRRGRDSPLLFVLYRSPKLLRGRECPCPAQRNDTPVPTLFLFVRCAVDNSSGRTAERARVFWWRRPCTSTRRRSAKQNASPQVSVARVLEGDRTTRLLWCENVDRETLVPVQGSNRRILPVLDRKGLSCGRREISVTFFPRSSPAVTHGQKLRRTLLAGWEGECASAGRLPPC